LLLLRNGQVLKRVL
jgi:hypothetical protein